MKDDKVLLSIDLIKPGMITAEVVFNRFGNALIWENITLNEGMIFHLKNIGIEAVTVYKEEMHSGYNQEIGYEPSSSLQFIVDYERDYNVTKQIFQEISAGRTLSVEASYRIVNSVMVKEKDNRSIIDSIMQVRNTDEYTYYHSLNVSMLCMMIGKWLRLDEINVKNLTLAGLLHDIGKCVIPLSILNKPGKLTDSEFADMRRHSEYGYNIVVGNSEISSEVAIAILTHHEKEDGSGYPFGILGDKLNLYSKVITVCDIFDAMTANRIYREKDTPLKVFELMQHGSFGILDPIVLKVFLDNITNYYIGSKVILNTGEKGEVVFMNKLDFSRPVVLVNNRYVDTSISKIERIEAFI